jgi:ubiquinone/menaquinone biosynthesis C-methylase UbiE
MLGGLDGKNVLDLGCGEGFYTRRVKRWGARDVVGVDISPRMIGLAQKVESRQPLGIQYVVKDVRRLGRIGTFDHVIASYLLNYARNKYELLTMCQTIASNLKPEARFVGINNNPDQQPESFYTTCKYGFTKTLSGPLREGAIIRYEFLSDGKKFQIENYYLSREIHAWAFAKAGFKNISWRSIKVAPEGIRKYGRAYWDDFKTYQPIVGIEAIK